LAYVSIGQRLAAPAFQCLSSSATISQYFIGGMMPESC